MNKHAHPTRWQREMIVQGWKLVAPSRNASPASAPAVALLFVNPAGETWTVYTREALAPETGAQHVTAVRHKDGKALEQREGPARKVCALINPSFRVRYRVAV